MANIYQEHGYESRADYLQSLAEDCGVDLDTVLMMAELLGPSEDYDGLVNTVQDIESGYY